MDSKATAESLLIVYNIPTGSIIPFVGAKAPSPGWLLCDGAPFDGNTYPDLLDLLPNSRTPNLSGMFLRGIGTSVINGQDGPALNETQDESFKSHNHDPGTLVAASTEAINNMTTISRAVLGPGDSASIITNEDNKVTGVHKHAIQGATKETGGTETRPVNYGVNYIIKT